MATSKTLWKLDEHTLGKHMVLDAYLKAWLPVMGTRNPSIYIIDGFAGPGEYINGELGSPQIMLDAHLSHSYLDNINCVTKYILLEKDPKRFEHLKALLTKNYKRLPDKIKLDLRNEDFIEDMSTFFSTSSRVKKRLPPSFIMLDPFGVSDTPLKIIEKILRNDKTEIYLSLMYEFINRFKSRPEFEKHLDELFGCEEWRNGINIADKIERRKFLTSLYKSQLKKAGATQVLHFDLCNGNRHVYTIFFATKHIKGCEKMKNAIWQSIPDGSYIFKGGTTQTLFDIKKPDYRPLHELLCRQYGGSFVSIEEVTELIASDRTDYPTDGLKTNYFKVFEQMQKIEYQHPERRKKALSYPPKSSLRFLP